MEKIFILSGPIRTGKSTRLIKWVTEQKSFGGIVQLVEDGKRCIVDLSKMERRFLETEDRNANTVNIGKFKFDAGVMEWAKICLMAAAKKKPGWLVVDEFGKLEMSNRGLEPVVSFLLNDFELRESTKIIVVVRENLFKEFLGKFELKEEDISTLDI